MFGDRWSCAIANGMAQDVATACIAKKGSGLSTCKAQQNRYGTADDYQFLHIGDTTVSITASKVINALLEYVLCKFSTRVLELGE